MKHKGPISGIAADGKNWIATAGYDNQVILWDARTHSSQARALHDHLANQCHFSPDSQFLVSASSDYSARLWRLPALQLVSIFAGHEDDVEMARFNHGSNLVVTASRDHCVRLFDLTGKCLWVGRGHSADVISVEWSDDDKYVISSSDDGSLKKWDAESGQEVDSIDLGEVETDSLVIHPSGMILAGNDEGEIHLIKDNETHTVKAHSAGIKRLVLARDKSQLISLSYDRKAKVWQIDSHGLKLVAEFSLPYSIWPRSCDFQDAETIVFATFGSTYASYSLTTKTWKLDQIEPTFGVNALCEIEGHQYTTGDAGIVWKNSQPMAKFPSLLNWITGQEDEIFTGGQDGNIFQIGKGSLYQHRSPLNCGVLVAVDHKIYLIVGSYTGELIILEKSKDRWELFRVIKTNPNAIKSIAASETELLCVDATGGATFVSLQDWNILNTLPRAHSKIANGCCAQPGNRFISISRDKKLYFFQNQSLLKSIETPHTHSIKCVASSDDGRWIASGSYSGVVWIYDDLMNEWIHGERPTASGLSSLTFLDNSFWATSYDGQVYKVQPERKAA